MKVVRIFCKDVEMIQRLTDRFFDDWQTGDTAADAPKILTTKQLHDKYSKDSRMEQTPRCSAKAQPAGRRSGQQ